MINELIELMKVQEQELKQLLLLLETQYKMIMDKDVFGLETLVDKLGQCSKKIAQTEVERRQITGSGSISEIVNMSDNDQLKEAYNNVQEALNKTIMRKDTNDILLKQQLMFTTKMLNIMNPSREIKTYNSYGNLSR